MVVTLLIFIAGCRNGGPHVFTTVNATGHVTTEVPAVPNVSPVYAMTVPGGACAVDAPRIAVIDVDGILLNQDFTGPGSLGENPVSLFHERLMAAANDPCTRAVVVRINSPGGGVTASDTMWHDLVDFKQRTRVPVVACLLDTGAGGAYYLATAADQIVAHPTSIAGGIGVVMNLYEFDVANATVNVTSNPILAGDYINAGHKVRGDASADRVDYEKKRSLLASMANEYHERFKNIVHQARPQVDVNDPEIGDGQVFTATRAQQIGLVDQVGYLDDAINMARRMANHPQAQVVLYHRTNDRPRTQYSVTPNVPLQTGLFPLSLPGLDRSKLPTFLYMWQPEPTMEKLVGR